MSQAVTSTAVLAEALAFATPRRFGRLATATATGEPSVVPCCFAIVDLDGQPAVVSVLDSKPKHVAVDRLRRVRDIRENPQATLLVDDTSEDWTRLAFAQLRGDARMLEPGSAEAVVAVHMLREKYAQYRAMPIDQAPVIAIERLRAAIWSAGDRSIAVRPTDLHATIIGRRSVRALLPQPVPEAIIRDAIEAASWAPSPHGRQPWRFAVLTTSERKHALADAMASTWQAQLALDGQDVSVVDIRLAKSRRRLLDAPALVLACLYLGDLDEYPDPDRQEAERVMAIQSLGAALQNLLLSVYAAGFDAGWMCAPLFCPEVVRSAAGLEAGLIPHALIPIGRAAKDPIRRPRRPVDDLIVDWS